MRFLGALSVIALHLGSREWFQSSGLGALHVLVSGVTGVTLFYVISGFLITTIIQREISSTGTFSLSNFVRRRALRIFPLYYFALLIYLLAGLVGIQGLHGDSFAFAALYSFNFVPRSIYDSWLGSFHTLATEEHFYILYPVLWVTCLRFRLPMWIILVVLCLLSPVTLRLSAPLSDSFFVDRWTFNAWGPILIGCLFAFVYGSLRDRSVVDRSLTFLAAFIVLFASQTIVPNPIVCAVSFGFLVLHFAFNPDRRSTAMLSGPAFRYLGSISYGLYVWQSFIISTGPGRRLVDNPVVAVGLVFILAILTRQFIEKPISQRKTIPLAA